MIEVWIPTEFRCHRQLPLAMHAKLAARIQQPVYDQTLQHLFPRDVFQRSSKFATLHATVRRHQAADRDMVMAFLVAGRARATLR